MGNAFDRLKLALAQRYRVEDEVGRGGMATVYRAHDLKHDRTVALKLLRPELAESLGPERFLREITLTARLDHPHILPLLDSGDTEGFLYYVMPYVEGESLRDRLSRERQLPLDDALQIAHEAADALSHAHSLGIVHRDIKPENILLSAGHARVADFGIARAVQAAGGETKLTATGIAAGTPLYMSPEQASGEREVDARTDVYSLACVLYEMLAGQPPYTGATPAAILALKSLEAVPSLRVVRDAVPPGVEEAITKALAKVPADRFGTASQFAEALERGRSTVGPVVPTTSGLPRRRLLLPTAAAVVLVMAGAWWVAQRDLGSPVITSLAVLPLSNLMGDPEQDYFVEGMHEALTAELAKIGALKVISRTSAMRYRGTDKAAPQIARELGVEGLVEGSVLRDADQVRITVQLIHGPTDRHLWAESYQRGLSEVLALQSEVARAVANEIRVTLTPSEEMQLAGVRPVDPEAYRAYLRARHHWNRRTQADLVTAVTFFKQAATADSTYAAAYVGLAETYNLLAGYGYLRSQEARDQARAAALRALEINADLGQAHIALAQAKWRPGRDWSAHDDFRRGLALSPNYATGYHWYGGFLTAIGRQRDGIEALKHAVSLDPLSLIINTDLAAEGYYFAREYEKAVMQLQEVVGLDRNFPEARRALCKSYVQLGRHAEAIAECENAAELGGRSPNALGTLGHAYAAAGRREAAQAVLQELEAQAEGVNVSAYRIAVVHTGLGWYEEALSWLDRALNEFSIETEWMKVDPRLDPLRPDPRFQDLLQRMNFPEQSWLVSER